VTLGTDKLFDAVNFVTELRKNNVSPHIAVNGSASKLDKARTTLIDAKTTRHESYAVNGICKGIKVGFGWISARRHATQSQIARDQTCRRPLHPRHGRLRSHPYSETTCKHAVTPQHKHGKIRSEDTTVFDHSGYNHLTPTFKI
jgi:hypothetical protein